MALKYFIDTIGGTGQYPKFIYISTSDSVAQVTATGFLNNIYSEESILSTSYMALVATGVIASGLTTQLGLFNVVKTVSGNVTNWSLVPVNPFYTPYAAQYTTKGGNASEAITITGALATDLAFVQLVNHGSNTVSVSYAVVTANTLTVTFSGDPGTTAIINYQLVRAGI